jgi:hypothetical protein
MAGRRDTKPPPQPALAEQAEATSSMAFELSTQSIGVRAYGATRSRGCGHAEVRNAPIVDAA